MSFKFRWRALLPRFAASREMSKAGDISPALTVGSRVSRMTGKGSASAVVVGGAGGWLGGGGGGSGWAGGGALGLALPLPVNLSNIQSNRPMGAPSRKNGGRQLRLRGADQGRS